VCGNGQDDNCDGRVDEGCVVRCEDSIGGYCGGGWGYGDCCSPECNTGGCSPDRFWAWCNRRNPAYPNIWDDYLRNWVTQHCDGTVRLLDVDGNGYDEYVCIASNGMMYTCETPLVLHLRPEAPVSLRPAAHSFRLGAGSPRHWPTPSTPWLALDRDGSGAIEDGSELFGSATPLASGRLARHGFEALAELDDNGDGLIDERDRVWPHLVAWSDTDGDGFSQPDELTPLRSLGLVAISLAYEIAPRCDDHGNCERERSRVWWRDARGDLRVGAVIDLHLRTHVSAPGPDATRGSRSPREAGPRAEIHRSAAASLGGRR
jgi:hypothetical protein